MKRAVLGWLAIGTLVALAAAYGISRSRTEAHVDGKRSAPTAAASPASTPASGGRGGGAPIAVSSVSAQARDVDVVLEATGTVSPLNSVEIRPQVSSIIMQAHIREGQFVEKGQVLFTLDARNDAVNIAKARAQLAKDNAGLADAQRQLARSRELLAQNFISQGAVDTTQTLVQSQQAAVAASRAAVEAAQVGLSYTRIVAPAAGRAGAINVFVGSTVQPTGPALVTITQLDPIAVAFSLPQRNVGEALQTLRSGGGKVLAVLPEKGDKLVGRLQFVDSGVDAASGTVRVKAQFENPDEKLWPGAFVSVRLAVRTLKDAVVVPQAAIITGPRGKVVYVIDAENRAASRPVEITYPFGDQAAVSGVEAGERVIVEGRQNVRPGSPVAERSASEEGRPRGKRGAGAASGAASEATPGAAAEASAAGGAAPPPNGRPAPVL